MTGHSGSETIHVVGIDCAVDPKRVGVAAATFTGKGLRDLELVAPRDTAEILDWVASRAHEAQSVLLALDSPLGWPAPLGRTLNSHRAGRPVEPEADELFRRLTDRLVRQRIGKQPLEVGADRIARTAVAALGLLAGLGHSMGAEIRLAWNPRQLPRASAIETYPAAWLLSRGLPANRYKDAGQEAVDRREEIAWNISPQFEAGVESTVRSQLIHSSHLLDAVICVLCGEDFLRGRCLQPRASERETAFKEGWIWFPDASAEQG